MPEIENRLGVYNRPFIESIESSGLHPREFSHHTLFRGSEQLMKSERIDWIDLVETERYPAQDPSAEQVLCFYGTGNSTDNSIKKYSDIKGSKLWTTYFNKA
jgi:hypothetical protein